MTIVLSEASRFGIVMVADSAITSTPLGQDKLPSGASITPYVRRGAEKICVMPDRPIAFSFWGMGRMGAAPTDLWLRDVLRGQTGSLDDICNAVAEEANWAFFNANQQEPGGFHVGAVEQIDGRSVPVLYHIHRGHDRSALGKFALHKDRPGSATVDDYVGALDAGAGYFLRNGAHETLAVLQGPLFQIAGDLQVQFGITLPSPPSIESQERWLRLQVGLLCDLFAISSHVSIVGRPLSSVTIDMNGVVRHASAVRDLGFV